MGLPAIRDRPVWGWGWHLIYQLLSGLMWLQAAVMVIV
jgi:hypothetical protein